MVLQHCEIKWHQSGHHCILQGQSSYQNPLGVTPMVLHRHQWVSSELCQFSRHKTEKGHIGGHRIWPCPLSWAQSLLWPAPPSQCFPANWWGYLQYPSSTETKRRLVLASPLCNGLSTSISVPCGTFATPSTSSGARDGGKPNRLGFYTFLRKENNGWRNLILFSQFCSVDH